jgi:hypothetical protein
VLNPSGGSCCAELSHAAVQSLRFREERAEQVILGEVTEQRREIS